MERERPPLGAMTLRQLRKIASLLHIPSYSRMRKEKLLEAIKDKEPTVAAVKKELPLASVDEGMGDLPSSYGENRIVLMPRTPQWAYAYWDVAPGGKEKLRGQGGQQLALRFYDVTDIDLESQSPHSVQEYPCDESAREWYLWIPVSDRDYAIDIGYRCLDGRWLVLARSAPMHVPPVYPSDWVEDTFITVNWEEDLRQMNPYKLTPPPQKEAVEGAANPIYQQIFDRFQSAGAERVVGSMSASLSPVPGSLIFPQPVSSHGFPSGAGMWAFPTISGIGLSGIGLMMSGVGFSASAPPVRPRQFWLLADAELIVYGATEPDATVTVGDRQIELNADGTFRFQMSFPDGLIDCPIVAVAADGEQTRSIQMKFNRETLSPKTDSGGGDRWEWDDFSQEFIPAEEIIN